MIGLAATTISFVLLAIGAAVLAGLGLPVPGVILAAFGAFYAFTLFISELFATISLHRRIKQEMKVLSRDEHERLRLQLRDRSSRCVLFLTSSVLFIALSSSIHLFPERFLSIDPGNQSSAPLIRAIDDLTSNLSKLAPAPESSIVQFSTGRLATSIDELRAAVEGFSARDQETRSMVRVQGTVPYTVTLSIFIASLTMAIYCKGTILKVASSVTASASLLSGATLLSVNSIEIHTTPRATSAPTANPRSTPVPPPTPPSVKTIELPSSPSFDFRSATAHETTLCGHSTDTAWKEWGASLSDIWSEHAQDLRNRSIVVIGMADPIRLGTLSQKDFGSNHGLARRRAEEVVQIMQSIAGFEESRFVVATDATDGISDSGLSADVCSPEFADKRRVKVIVSAKGLKQPSSSE